jgi:hypothetical protein
MLGGFTGSDVDLVPRAITVLHHAIPLHGVAVEGIR